ncbi:MAG TPA: hypothetical protein VFB38_03080 [Chthonomonadaceae bacterium]|nr:hypothetical protein [Chthonomonadaceae bacterium]
MRKRDQFKWRRGWTLAEVLTVVLIVIVLMAIAMPAFQNGMSASRQSACRANMQALANAEEQYRRQSATHAYTTQVSALSKEAAGVPVCPDGGTYTITISNGTATAQNGQTVPQGGLVISCSIGSHGKFAPGIDTP